MSKGVPPSPGSLIEVDHAGDTVLALVRDVNRRGRLNVITRHGDALTLSSAKVQTDLELTIANPPDDEAALAALTNVGAEVDEAQAGIDLEMIWQLVVADGASELSCRDLATLWFDDDGAVASYSMLRALRDDAVYFKRGKGGRFTPRGDKDVEAVRQQVEAEQRRAEAQRAFVDAVLSCIEAHDPQTSGERLRDDHEQRPYLELIVDWAACGDRFDRKDEAERLLEAINERLEPVAARDGRAARPGHVRVSATGAFDLLRWLRLVEEHENLALRRYRIRTSFEPELLAEARALAESADALDLSGLTARPDRQPVTIDDASTRDMDDALDVRELDDGGCEIGIHITDVAALVRPGSALDVEAQKRGASVYLPTGVIPMLPEVLSEGALSLIAGQPRPVLSFLVRFDADHQLVDHRLEMAVITVRERLTYEDADEQLDSGQGRWARGLERLQAVARAREQARLDAGAFRIDLPDVDVKVVGGEPRVRVMPRSSSRALVAEMAVLAGELAANYCLDEGIPTVFRTQDVPVEEAAVQRVDAIDDPLVREFERTRLLRRGELRSSPAPHRGLGLAAYVQVTSPIRRYADLIVHYQLREHLLGRPPLVDPDEMVALAARAEAAASDCVAAQRDTDRYWILEYLRRRDDPVTEGVVLHFDPAANRPTVAVLLPDFMLRSTLGSRGRSVGERLPIRVVKANPRRDLLQIALAEDR